MIKIKMNGGFTFCVVLVIILICLYPVKDTKAVGLSSGTGFFINDNGDVATAAHVVKDNSELYVIYKNKYRRARVVGVDDYNDVAVINIKEKSKTKFLNVHPASVGSQVAIIGYPLPTRFGPTLHIQLGIVTSNPTNTDPYVMVCGWCYPGNSGGPVMDNTGTVVGMLVAGDTIPIIEGSIRSYCRPVKSLLLLTTMYNVATTIAQGKKHYTWSSLVQRLDRESIVVLILNFEKPSKEMHLDGKRFMERAK